MTAQPPKPSCHAVMSGSWTPSPDDASKGRIRISALLKLLDSGNNQGAAVEIPRWNKAGGQVLLGLTRRRNVEGALFLGKPWEAFVNS